MAKKTTLSFSQRKGLKPAKTTIQTDSMDIDLHNSLWSALINSYFHLGSPNISNDSYLQSLMRRLWLDYFKKPIDSLSNSWHEVLPQLRKYFYSCEWYEVYDLIEFCANNYSIESTNKRFIGVCNFYLERELSAYRFVTGVITQITSEEEISAIEEALKADYLKPVHTHLTSALSHLSDRKSPDYRNSIKESISAVEAISRLIMKKPTATLGAALKKIEDKVEIHAALKESFKKLYGYTSDEQGIRHSLLDESDLDFEDAKFMLVACSAFINYLISKSSKAGVEF